MIFQYIEITDCVFRRINLVKKCRYDNYKRLGSIIFVCVHCLSILSQNGSLYHLFIHAQ